MWKVEFLTDKPDDKKLQYKVKHFQSGININTLPEGTVIRCNDFHTLHVSDEGSLDFNVVVLSGDEDIYYTSSTFFEDAITDIFGDFSPEEDGEEGLLSIRILKPKSKTRKGPDGNPATFLTCEIV